MNELLIVAYIPFHIGCGILAYGYNFAYYQRKYSILAKRCYKEDMLMSIFTGLLGPIGLFVCYMSDCKKAFKYGFKWR